jgi:penicillin-binding protein-related factor A (putative recombinase)
MSNSTNPMNNNDQGRAKRPTNNHLRGAALEDLLKWTHNTYRANSLAWVWQNGTKGIVRRGQVILQQSLPDFGGVITSLNGRYVSFDAKLMSAGRSKTGALRYSHPSDRLHQLRDLWDVQKAGGIAFLLISVDLERFFMVWPQASWGDEHPFSVRLDALEDEQGIEFERNGFYKLPDWLSVIQHKYGNGASSTNGAQAVQS